MLPHRRWRLVTALVAAGALTAGCSAVEDLVASRTAEEPDVAVLGVVVPLQGTQQAAGAGVADAVRLAVADAGGTVGGWGVEVVVVDDRGQPADAVAATEALLEDRRVIGVVGGLSAPVVRAVQPLLDARDVAFVSPADTDRTHTRGADPQAPLRPYGSYFRTAAGGRSEGAAAAAYAAEALPEGAVVATVASAAEAGASRLVGDFTTEAAARGLTVTPLVLPEDADPAATVAAAREAGAAAVFTGQTAAAAAGLLAAMEEAGWRVPLVGGPALREEAFLAAAGEQAESTVATDAAPVPPTAGLSGDLGPRLDGAGLESEPGPFGAAAHDAAAALLQAWSRCLPPAPDPVSARPGCVAEMSEVSFSGLTGPVRFSEYGERTSTSATSWQVRGGAWEPLG